MTALTAAAVLELALGAGFSRADADVMTVIAHFESGCDPNNIGDQTLSRYGSRGLWQVFTGAWTPADFGLGHSGWNKPLVAELAAPATNARAARVVFKAQGFSAWSTYNSFHGDAAWQKLLAQVQAIKAVGGTNPPSRVAKPTKDYLARKGNTNPHAAKAIEFAKAEVAHQRFSWKRRCASLVRHEYGLPMTAWGDAATNAASAFHLVPSKFVHTWYTAPAGCPVYWTGGSSGAGHVALADGHGNVYSNDFGPDGYIGDGRVRLVPQAAISAHDKALKFVGWGEFYLGVRVYN